MQSGEALLDKEKHKILSPMMDVIFKLLMGNENSKELLTDFLFTDALQIHTLEVPKARKVSEDASKADLLNWMKFFDIKTEEELDVLAQKSPAMKRATLRLKELSADEKARQLYEARLKEQRDSWAREKGAVLKIAKNLLSVGDTIEKIVMVTGLTYEEVEDLQNADS